MRAEGSQRYPSYVLLVVFVEYLRGVILRDFSS